MNSSRLIISGGPCPRRLLLLPLTLLLLVLPAVLGDVGVESHGPHRVARNDGETRAHAALGNSVPRGPAARRPALAVAQRGGHVAPVEEVDGGGDRGSRATRSSGTRRRLHGVVVARFALGGRRHERAQVVAQRVGVDADGRRDEGRAPARGLDREEPQAGVVAAGEQDRRAEGSQPRDLRVLLHERADLVGELGVDPREARPRDPERRAAVVARDELVRGLLRGRGGGLAGRGVDAGETAQQGVIGVLDAEPVVGDGLDHGVPGEPVQREALEERVDRCRGPLAAAHLVVALGSSVRDDRRARAARQIHDSPWRWSSLW
mmetsp:Transcript_22787/g.90371  ORF Transcript_22787/g.90371 Transcript_22787/m.90371 type:complete len:320 (-) Transcript_22787:595-1554(-)